MSGESTALKAAFLSAYNAQITSTNAQPGPVTALSEDQADAIITAVVAAINSTLVTFALSNSAGAVAGTITLTATAS